MYTKRVYDFSKFHFEDIVEDIVPAEAGYLIAFMELSILNHNKIVLFFGLPGAGKSTVAKMFAEMNDGLHLEADDYLTESFKEAVKNNFVTKDMRDSHSLDVISAVNKSLPSNVVCVSKGCAHIEDRLVWLEHFNLVHVECSLNLLQKRVSARNSWVTREILEEIAKVFTFKQKNEHTIMNSTSLDDLVQSISELNYKLNKGA